MNRKREKSESQKLIFPGIIFAVTIIAILCSFGIKMISEAKNQVAKDYKNDVNELCQVYNKQIYVSNVISDLVVREILKGPEIFDESNIENIKTVSETEGVKNIYIIAPDYSAIDAKGNAYETVEGMTEIMESIDKMNRANRFYKNAEGKNRLYECRGIISDNVLLGYVVIEYAPELNQKVLENPRFTARKTFALVSADGDIIETVGKSTEVCKEGSNIIDTAVQFEFITGSYSSFKQAVKDCRSGFQQIVHGGEGKYIYYSPLDNCKAIVVMVVDYADVERSFNEVSKSIRRMLIGIGATLFVFIVVFAAVGLFNKAKYNIESVDLQNKADTDQLTDLYNKMATERMIKEYLSGEGKDKVSMLFVLDVDNFKKINDTMGHAFGDKVLAQLGHQIRAWFRVNDIVGRIGGDEFMVFIKDVKNPEVLKREGSRIMQFFEGFNVGEYTRYSPTASVGGAVYPYDADDFESLYKAADKAVYRAKKGGKNQVALYGDLDSEEKLAESSKE